MAGPILAMAGPILAVAGPIPYFRFSANPGPRGVVELGRERGSHIKNKLSRNFPGMPAAQSLPAQLTRVQPMRSEQPVRRL
jgi:hypothetical protein